MSRNQWEKHSAQAARMEVRVMQRLQQMPSTAIELEYYANVPERRIRTILGNLREAGCVYRVPGTHLMALREAT